MSLRHKVFNGAMWASFAQVLSMACTFTLTIVLARGLSPADYGFYFVALNSIVILVNVGTIGMDRVVVRFAAIKMAASNRTGLPSLVFSCLGVVVVAAAITSVAFLCLSDRLFSSLLHMPALTLYTGILALWLFSATIQGQLTETFRGLNDIRFSSLFSGVRSNGILNALIVVCVMGGFWLCDKLTLVIALRIMTVTSIVIVLAALMVLRSRMQRLTRTDIDADALATSPWRVRDALLESWPYWLTAMITTLRLQGGVWLAGAMDSTEHVALYGVGQRMMMLLVGPMIISNAVLPPIVAQLHSTNQLPRLERVIRSISGMLLIPSMGLVLALVIGGKPILNGLFGPYYTAAYPILVILCLGQVFNIATGAWQTVMPMTGNQRLMLVTSIIAIATQLSLGLFLGHLYGVIGVAIGFSASLVVTNLIGMFFVHRRLGIWTYASLDVRAISDAGRMIAAKLGRKAGWQK